MKWCSYRVGIIVDISDSFDDQHKYITIGSSPYDVNTFIKLVCNEKTLVLGPKYREIRLEDLEVGDLVVAYYSNAMTKSIPPQATAYIIKKLNNE